MLIDSNSLLNINQIVSQLQITKRTAYSTINGVNSWLEMHNLNKIMTIRTHGYYIQPYEAKKIEKYLEYDLQKGNIKIPQFVRKTAIEFALLCKKAPVPLKYLDSLNGVTTRTTHSDLVEVKNEVERRNLKLCSVNHGYIITGPEEEIRKFALQKLANIQGTVVYDKIAGYFNLKTKDKLQIEQMLLTIEQNSGCYLTDESIFQVKKYICFSLIRYRHLHYLEASTLPSKKQLARLSNSESLIFSLLKYLGIADEYLIPEERLLSKIIESRQISKISKKIESQTISRITKEIIRRFSVISGIDLVHNSNLQDDLTTHLIAAQRRVLYNVQFINSSLLNFKSKYPEIYFLTKEAIQPFERYLKKTLTTDEIELIAIYFGGEIELLNNSNGKRTYDKIILVCGSGIGTSRLLKIQLEKIFSDQLQISVITKQDYENVKEIHATLVIATLPVTNKGAPIINVNRILTDFDMQTIKQHLSCRAPSSFFSHNSPAVKTTQILDIVSEYAQIKDFASLTTALQSYFSKGITPIKKGKDKQPCLSELLPKKRIAFKNKEYSWQEAVELAGNLLERDNIVNKKYTQKMSLQIKKYGPYMKIMDNVMLIHAKPDFSSEYTLPGMSLVCFKRPVDFGKNIKANYVFSLYAPISNSHLKALTQLTEIFSNKNLLVKFENAKNSESLIRLFNFIEKGDEQASDVADRSQISSSEC